MGSADLAETANFPDSLAVCYVSRSATRPGHVGRWCRADMEHSSCTDKSEIRDQNLGLTREGLHRKIERACRWRAAQPARANLLARRNSETDRRRVANES
jgi:hypothetical protein